MVPRITVGGQWGCFRRPFLEPIGVLEIELGAAGQEELSIGARLDTLPRNENIFAQFLESDFTCLRKLERFHDRISPHEHFDYWYACDYVMR